MFLASTSDILRIVTGQAVSTIAVHASWVDLASGAETPDNTNTLITTATTTTIVGSPGASTVRNVKTIKITNNHATSSCVITVQHFDGTTSVDIEKITLYPSESFTMAEDGEWRHLTAVGGEYEYSPRLLGNLGIAGTVAEVVPREQFAELNISTITSGTLYLQGVYLTAGTVVTNISYFSATTAAGTPTNQFFCLYSDAGQLLAQTANATTAAWAANTLKTLALTAPYTVQKSGFYYVGIMITATTVPTVKGMTMSSQTLVARNPCRQGTSTAGLTTALPGTCLLPTTSNSTIPWAALT